MKLTGLQEKRKKGRIPGNALENKETRIFADENLERIRENDEE